MGVNEVDGRGAGERQGLEALQQRHHDVQIKGVVDVEDGGRVRDRGGEGVDVEDVMSVHNGARRSGWPWRPFARLVWAVEVRSGLSSTPTMQWKGAPRPA